MLKGEIDLLKEKLTPKKLTEDTQWRIVFAFVAGSVAKGVVLSLFR